MRWPAWMAVSASQPMLTSIMTSMPPPIASRIALTFSTSSRHGRMCATCILMAFSPMPVNSFARLIMPSRPSPLKQPEP